MQSSNNRLLTWISGFYLGQNFHLKTNNILNLAVFFLLRPFPHCDTVVKSFGKILTPFYCIRFTVVMQSSSDRPLVWIRILIFCCIFFTQWNIYAVRWLYTFKIYTPLHQISFSYPRLRWQAGASSACKCSDVKILLSKSLRSLIVALPQLCDNAT